MRNRGNILDCASRLAVVMSLAPPNETSQKLHSSLIQNMFDSSSLLVLSKGQIDKISVSYQLRILTLVRAISNISDGVQIRINGMKTSINLLSQISVNTYINNQGISIEFLRALLWEVAVIDSLILQRIFTAEVSKSCPNVSLMNILFTALKRCFVRVGGNVDDKSGFETVCDSIVWYSSYIL
jgi:hypothetical protein